MEDYKLDDLAHRNHRTNRSILKNNQQRSHCQKRRSGTATKGDSGWKSTTRSPQERLSKNLRDNPLHPFHEKIKESYHEDDLLLKLEDIRLIPDMMERKKLLLRDLKEYYQGLRNARVHGAIARYFIGLKYRMLINFDLFVRQLWKTAHRFRVWERKSKLIESQFGRSVLAYFVFLKMLIWFNIPLLVIVLLFIIIPQIVHDKTWDLHQHSVKFNFMDLLRGDGFLDNTEMYVGYYGNWTVSAGNFRYSMPAAYMYTSIACIGISLLYILFSITRCYIRDLLRASGGYGFYTQKIFTGWDYGITGQAVSSYKHKSIFFDLVESLRNFDNIKTHAGIKLWIIRLVINAFVLSFIGALCVVVYVLLSKQQILIDADDGSVELFFTPLSICIVNLVLPWLFKFLVRYENYQDPKTVLYLNMSREFLVRMSMVCVIIHYWFKRDGDKCWVNHLGQEFYRIIVFDFLIGGLLSILLKDAFVYILSLVYRGRLTSPLEFDLGSSIQYVIYSQAVSWLGFFWCPFLPFIGCIKLCATMLMKYNSLVVFCRPPSHVWVVSQMNTNFLFILLWEYLICAGIVFYFIHMVNISNLTCGPFNGAERASDVINSVELKGILSVIGSNYFLLYTCVTLTVVIYYFQTRCDGERKVRGIIRNLIAAEGRDKTFLMGLIRGLDGHIESVKGKQSAIADISESSVSAGLALSGSERRYSDTEQLIGYHSDVISDGNNRYPMTGRYSDFNTNLVTSQDRQEEYGQERYRRDFKKMNAF